MPFKPDDTINHSALCRTIPVDLELVMYNIHHYHSLLHGNINYDQIYSMHVCNLQQVGKLFGKM
jgi:hypothetical protein